MTAPSFAGPCRLCGALLSSSSHTQLLLEEKYTCVCVCSFTWFFLNLCDPMDGSPPGSSVHGISQTRIQEWVAISCSRGPSWPRDWTHISFISCIGRRFLTSVSPRKIYIYIYIYISIYICSVAQLCLTLCNPMGCCMPGFPVLHHLAQTHVHWVGDAIQPSHPPSSSCPVFNLAQHQGLF